MKHQIVLKYFVRTLFEYKNMISFFVICVNWLFKEKALVFSGE